MASLEENDLVCSVGYLEYLTPTKHSQIQEIAVPAVRLSPSSPLAKRQDPDFEHDILDPIDPVYNSSGSVILERDSDDNRLRKRAVVTGPGWNQLVSISQPEGASFNDMKGIYTYDPTAGLGTVVYSLDTGVYAGNSVNIYYLLALAEMTHSFTNPPQEFSSTSFSDSSYLYPGPSPISSPGDFPMPTTSDSGGHGSCMMSLLVGRTCGIARNAQPIATVINPYLWTEESYLDGLSMIYDHVIKNGNNKNNAVVNMSLNFKPSIVSPSYIARLGK
jgi:hypothetical protein